MAKNTQEGTPRDPGILETLGSLQFALVVLIAIALVATVGTVVPQGKGLDFYRDTYGGLATFVITVFRFDTTYSSPLFLGLLVLFGVNLTLCSIMRFPAVYRRAFNPERKPSLKKLRFMAVHRTVKDAAPGDIAASFASHGFKLQRTGEGLYFGEKGRFGYLGAFIVHLSLIVMLTGGLVSLVTGVRGYIRLAVGESADEAIISETETIPLGFTVTLNEFDVQFYENYPDRPKSYRSTVTVTTPEGGTFDRDIRVNSPLMRNSFTVYQSSYGVSRAGETMSAANDTAYIAVRLAGAPETMPPLTTLALPPGEVTPVPGFADSVAVRVSELHRSFRMGGGGDNRPNPAAKIDVFVNDEIRWSVYSFKNFPGLNMPMYDDIMFHFTLTSIGMPQDGGEMAGTSEASYYTVLGVVRDRGTTIMWIGALLMAVGLVLSFFLRPRRLWVAADGPDVVVGGTVKGDVSAFRNYVANVLEHTGAQGDTADA